MASEQNASIFPDDEIDDDEESQDEEEYDELRNNDDEEDFNSASPVPDPSSTITVAIPGTTVPNGEPFTAAAATVIVDSTLSDSKRFEKKPFDDSRKLFQRLWTDEDEIRILQGFLEYTTQRGSCHHQDTTLFYDQIKSKLQLEFNKNQLVEKLRRLKKKYRNVVEKITNGKTVAFKSSHDQATFEISRKIWDNTGRIGVEDHALDDDDSNPNPNPNPNLSHSEVKIEETVGVSAEKKTPKLRKRSRAQFQPQSELGTVEKRVLIDGLASINNNNSSNSNVVGLIEETVRSCLSPLFKELLTNAACGPCGGRGIGGVTLNPMPLSFGDQVLDEKWRKQQILELEVYSKRLELVQDQIKVTLEELRSAGAS